MSLPSDILNDLIALDLPAKKFAGVMAIVGRLVATEEARLVKIREKTALYRSRGGGNIPPEMRLAVFERDKYQCTYCGSSERLECDHIIAVSKGGETSLENLAAACKSCNSRKRDRDRKFLERSNKSPRTFSDTTKDNSGLSADGPFPKQKVSPVTPSKTQPLSEEIDRARAREVHADFLEAIGVAADDPALFGAVHSISALLSRGFSRETILAGAARAMAGKSKPPNWPYFAKVIETENEQRSSPAKPEFLNAKTPQRGGIMEAVNAHIERLERDESGDSPPRRDPPRLLSNG